MGDTGFNIRRLREQGRRVRNDSQIAEPRLIGQLGLIYVDCKDGDPGKGNAVLRLSPRCARPQRYRNGRLDLAAELTDAREATAKRISRRGRSRTPIREPRNQTQ